MRNILIILLAVLLFNSCKKDEVSGCTDPSALNYDSNATNDDGSCNYSTAQTSNDHQLNFYIIENQNFNYTDVYVKVDGDSIGEPEVITASTFVNGEYEGSPQNIPPSSLIFNVEDGVTYLLQFFDKSNDQLIGEITGLPIVANEPDGYFFGQDPGIQLTTYGNNTFTGSYEESFGIDDADNELFYTLSLQY